MPNIQVNAVLPYTTNLPRDVAVNTWHFATEGAFSPGDQIDEIYDRLDDFYNDPVTPPGVALANYLSRYITRDALGCRFEFYNLDDPPPRAPIVRQFTLGGSTDGLSLPLEVALCLSFKSAPISGVPRARTRGRVYIGPLTRTALSGVADGPPLPLPNLVTVLSGAATAMLARQGDIGCFWTVHSRTEPGNWPVADGWVDDEMDTQRRRGLRAGSRVLWP